MPSSSRGLKVAAAIAKARPTTVATATSRVTSASRNGTTTATTADRRKAVTPSRRLLITSWEITPATAMVSPDDVARKAANAPAVSSAVRRSPPRSPTIRPGSSSTTLSARPLPTRSGA